MTEEKRCLALTSEEESCNNKAIYPKEDPVACHIKAHQEQMLEKTFDEEVKEKEVKEDNLHVFASTAKTHMVFVNYPKDDKRDYFRVVFNEGGYTTKDDEKARLLEKSIKKSSTLSKKITKVQ